MLNQDLITRLHERWTKYLQDTLIPIVYKQDPSLVKSTAEQTWIALASRVEADKVFKEACTRQSEKFGMQFQQLVREERVHSSIAVNTHL